MSAAAPRAPRGRAGPEPRRVLVTHADRPVGRRVVEDLLRDGAVRSIVAVGQGPAPRSFERLLGPQLRYRRVALAKHQEVTELFEDVTRGDDAIDAVIYVPRHGALPASDDVPVENEPRSDALCRAAEARQVRRACLRTPGIRSLVVLGSAFVYRLEPGNANRVNEACELDFDPTAPEERRSWVDCDTMLRREVPGDRLRIVLLRVPTVFTETGELFFHPTLSSIGHESTLGSLRPDVRPLGYDPLCALVSDADVARAVRLALHGRSAGAYNVAGHEALPLSVLSGWTGRWELPLPGPLLSAAFQVVELPGLSWLRVAADARQLRHGFTLDTSKAERELGFHASDHIAWSGARDGKLRIEGSPVEAPG